MGREGGCGMEGGGVFHPQNLVKPIHPHKTLGNTLAGRFVHFFKANFQPCDPIDWPSLWHLQGNGGVEQGKARQARRLWPGKFVCEVRFTHQGSTMC